MRKLVALYSDDGYLHYASDVEGPGNPYSPEFWPMYSGDDYYRNWDLVELTSVPDDIAKKLIAQGTSEQWYADGYEAASAAGPYIAGTIYRHYGEDRLAHYMWVDLQDHLVDYIEDVMEDSDVGGMWPTWGQEAEHIATRFKDRLVAEIRSASQWRTYD